MFSPKDLHQISSQGIGIQEIETQIENFKKGFPFLHIEKAATVGDGIVRLSADNLNWHIDAYNKALADKKIVKFVPASGAATRMFKDLFAFLDGYDGSEAAKQKFFAKKDLQSISYFFEKLEQFAYYSDLKEILKKQNKDLETLKKNADYKAIIQALLDDSGLGYGSLPKGLLKFHRYEGEARTPVEEHIVEGANYGKDKSNKVRIHFTVSPEHEEKFKDLINKKVKDYEKQFGIQLDISFSQQKKSTDTIAVDLENNPFRNQDGSLLFRPAGHGALLENLNDIDADLIFIKNIDNVVPDRIKEDTYTYKKALGGLLLHYQDKIWFYQKSLNSSVNESFINEVVVFFEKELCVLPPQGFDLWSKDKKIEYFKHKLNRPLKVCGMVKNEGEPGGGPFWAVNSDGTVSLQIAESAQIDMKNETQKNIAKNATHFNPVDLVCGVKDFQGKKYDLRKFRDPATGFISEKSKDGKPLKAQELPGLWNGAMSDWNTIFVEVPIITFNPVKTVNDLLREQHQ
jgi:hypothetical protein